MNSKYPIVREAPTIPVGGTFSIKTGKSILIRDVGLNRKQLVLKNKSATGNLKLALGHYDETQTDGSNNNPAFFKTLTVGEEWTVFMGGDFFVVNESGVTVIFNVLQVMYN